ncbi:MAG: polysulfide reductase NrfD [Ignavibacteriota bacterium]|jgi:formate-dependent nitrite reductase membrane component NrfD|nr:MAG: polysulfide reductase [Chlorobiota bacterium]MBE7478112.1 polysulfide reductase NrfD [Ignavibacteriales bacterium]MBL1121659.1 polysulfide reductase [Ignavibacteriota bacterium]MCC7095196.1 polysulfide reductase NrfD [Ignavibacteriaceae bacterium]MCE7856869.1 polysulfide reductase [Ignavibacteria bacterium CHB3]MEB2296946.1 polysulfide reductase NrfD [Ignavibacteria bacterium]
MHEIFTTRHNPDVDPWMTMWGWEIPVYLFLGGMVAGMMIIAGYFLFSGRHKESNCSCYSIPLTSFVLLSIGMFSLFLDLAHKQYVWRLYTTFQITSPMSWGAWILILVYPALIANILIRPPSWMTRRFSKLSDIAGKLQTHQFFIKNIGILNMILGMMLGAYTGVLLSTMGSRPLWNTSLLWVLFLVSGLSTAAAYVHLIAKNRAESELLAKADNGFLVVELFIFVMLFLGLMSSARPHIEAAQLLLTGIYAPAFWVFVIALGIVIPLGIQLLAVNHKIKHTPIAPIMVIIGGLILRFIIVEAGQYSHWFNAHFK